MMTSASVADNPNCVKKPRRSCSPINSNNKEASFHYDQLHNENKEAVLKRQPIGSPGLRGLQNIGNTCFMNSALQCMSNTPILVLDYFVPRLHEADINTSNPLGMQGEVAEAFADLVGELWRKNNSISSNSSTDDAVPGSLSGFGASASFNSHNMVVVPRRLKTVIGRFEPQFRSFMQQDSQELLGFLLDGLHEDLNLIKKKPFISTSPNIEEGASDKRCEGENDKEKEKDSGKRDEELALEAWKAHRARNNSIIVDFFQGQYRSRVRCHKCNCVSTTFDPFMILPLPLPRPSIRTVALILVPLNGPLRTVDVQVMGGASISEVLRLVNHEAGLRPAVVELNPYTGCVRRVYPHHERLPPAPGSSGAGSQIADEFLVYDLAYTNADCHNKTSPGGDGETSSIKYVRSFVTPVYKNQPVDVPIVVSIPEYHQQEETFRCIFSAFAHRLQVPIDTVYKIACTEDNSLPDLISYTSNSVVDPNLKVNVGDNFKFSIAPTEKAYRTLMRLPSFTDPRHLELASQAGLLQPEEENTTNDSLPSVNNSGIPESFQLPPPSPLQRASCSPKTSIAENFFNIAKQSDNENENVEVGGADYLPAVFSYMPGRSRARVLPCLRSTEAQLVHTIQTASSVHGALGQLPIPMQHPSPFGYGGAMYGSSSNETVNLQECFNMFSSNEVLMGSETVYCAKCKEHGEATKKVDLWRLPPVLVIALKRFAGHSQRHKLSTAVHYPCTLTMDTESEAGATSTYNLYGVINHYGGLGGGHYTAHARSPVTRQWYEYNDSKVSEVEGPETPSSAAYVLFYCRNDMSRDLLNRKKPSTSPSSEQGPEDKEEKAV